MASRAVKVIRMLAKNLILRCPAAAIAALIIAGVLAAVRPALGQRGAPSVASRLADTGPIDITASRNIVTPSGAVWSDVHARTQSGATLDCDTLRADTNPAGKVTGYLATGSVKAHFAMSADETCDVTADKAVSDPLVHQIDLTGNVKATVYSPQTVGPLIQTGQTGVVLLGPSASYPDVTQFPTIIMNVVHTQFTPRQQVAGPTSHANPREEPGQGVQGTNGRR